MRLHTAVPAVLTGAIVLAGLGACSSSDGSAASATASATPTASAAPTASATSAKAVPAEAVGFCDVLADQAKAAASAPAVAPTGAALQAYVQQSATLNQRLLAAAPAAIKKDLAVAVSVSTLSGEVAKDRSRVPELEAKLKDPAVTAANQRVSTYASSVCDMTKITGAAGTAAPSAS